MNVMTDLYQDRPMAVLREYTTNGRDAHIEAGIDEPIQVFLPDRFNPTLRIRDFGYGLDLEQVRHIYTKYGASTKRDTNEAIGAFGLGCKSALTYANQFSVTSIKDGLKHRMTVHRDVDGASSVTVMSGEGEPTDERSGVEISIPTKRYDSFETEANNLFRFWDKGTVLVNGKEPTRIDGLWISDKLVLANTEEYHTSYIVMGGVPYPVAFENLTFKEGYSLVAFVPIGAVSPMYSREALHMTPETKAAIAAVEEEFGKKIQVQVQSEVDKAETAWQAVEVAQHWHFIVPATSRANEYVWKGKKMPAAWELKNDDTRTKLIGVVPNSRRLRDSTRERSLPVEAWPKTIWVTGYDRPTFTANQKKKLTKWAEDNGFTDYKFKDNQKEYRRFILVERLPRFVRQWVDPKRIVRWEIINAIKLPRTNSGGYGGGHPLEGRIPGSYDVWIGGEPHAEYAADDIDQNQPVFYFASHGGGFNYAQVIAQKWPEATVVTFYSNRLDKFTRNFPNARPARDGATEIFEEWRKKLTKRDRYALYLHSTPDIDRATRSILESIDPNRIIDPKLRISARMYQRAKGRTSATVAMHKRFQNSLGGSVAQVDLTDVKWSDPVIGYDLLTEASSSYALNRMLSNAPEHIYTYVNAAYEAGLTKTRK